MPYEKTFLEFLADAPPRDPYQWGWHTACIARALQHASDELRAGRSTYLIVNVPPRHGKSDLCSRRFPVWHLLREPDHEVILTTYSAALSEDMSRAARRCFAEEGPKNGFSLAKDRKQIGCWCIEGKHGGVIAVGLGGPLTGRGAHVLIVDDYVKNRADADSLTIRERVWDGFRADMMSRLAPAHAVVILATRWHEDDLTARLLKEDDPFFPKFQHLVFPAWGTYPPPGLYAPGADTRIDFAALENQERGERWLFPERFRPGWYESQRAVQGTYNWQALFLCDPIPRGGRQFKTENVRIAENIPGHVRLCRGWDLASCDWDRGSDNPDFTVGVLAGIHEGTVYVVDVVRGRWSAPQRDARMCNLAAEDGIEVTVCVETVGGYKDTYSNVKWKLAGKAHVRPLNATTSKSARAEFLENYFETGQVVLKRAPWNRGFIDELAAFPSKAHDDQVDALVAALYHMRRKRCFTLEE